MLPQTHSYSAKSGVGIIIIGEATGKILYMGDRNKYCAVCCTVIRHSYKALMAIHQNIPGMFSQLENRSSSAMKTDIILDGFCNCEEQHGV